MISLGERNKVLIIGDSGVGKSSLVHLICHGRPVASASWTIGASIELKDHEYAEGTPHQRSAIIELWEIGGSKSHFIARKLLFKDIHGIILVHDLTNCKSHDNLRKWLSEVFCNRDLSKEPVSFCHWLASVFFGAPPSFEGVGFDPEVLVERNIPVLVVGTKVDLASNSSRLIGSSGVAQDCRAEEISVDCTNPRSFAPGSTNAVTLSRFFDRVLERKCNRTTVDSNSKAFVVVDKARMRNPLPFSMQSASSYSSSNSSSRYPTSVFIPNTNSKYSHID